MFPTTECNLRCKYCFHANGEYKKEQMSIEFLEFVFEKLFKEYDYLQFIWHGGEPLCVGLDFYRKALELERVYSKKYNTIFDNGIMTNGTLITDEIASFFSENEFDVGVSFDGISNDSLRGKSNDVIKGINILNRHNCDVDIVSVITNNNLYNQIENYESMKSFHSELKYNPVAKIGGGNDNSLCEMNVKDYIKQCCSMFDYWLFDQNEPLKLQPYYDYIRDIVERTSSGCQRTSCLGRWIALHPNGDIFPCVRESNEDYRFGNILEMNKLDEIWESEAFLSLLESSISRREKCKMCSLFNFCHGGCPVNAITGNGSFSCETFKGVFGHVLEQYYHIVRMNNAEFVNTINPLVAQLIKGK